MSEEKKSGSWQDTVSDWLISIIVAVVRKFVLLLPLIYIVPHLVSNPVWGVYLAEPVADIIAVTFTAVLFGNRFRKALERLSQEA